MTAVLRPPEERARFRRRLLVASAVLLGASLLIALPTTFRFIRGMFPESTFVVVEFDAGVPREITPERPDESLALCMVVEDLKDPVPPLRVTVRDAAGRPVPTEPYRGWKSQLGRQYQRLLLISPEGPGPITILVEATGEDGAGQDADFAVFRYFNDVLSRHLAGAMPWWFVSAGVLAASAAAFGVALVSRIRDDSEPVLD